MREMIREHCGGIREAALRQEECNPVQNAARPVEIPEASQLRTSPSPAA